MQRKSIPKSLKHNVWNKYIGRENGVGPCFCCKNIIDSKAFECGHIIAQSRGGPTTERNLRPICCTCNKSMGTMNLIEFMNKYFPSNSSNNKRIQPATKNKFTSQQEPKQHLYKSKSIDNGIQIIDLLNDPNDKIMLNALLMYKFDINRIYLMTVPCMIDLVHNSDLNQPTIEAVSNFLKSKFDLFHQI